MGSLLFLKSPASSQAPDHAAHRAGANAFACRRRFEGRFVSRVFRDSVAAQVAIVSSARKRIAIDRESSW
jgi:hypothetical protein